MRFIRPPETTIESGQLRLQQLLNLFKRSNIKTISESQNVREGEIERMLEDIKEEITNKEIKGVEKGSPDILVETV